MVSSTATARHAQPVPDLSLMRRWRIALLRNPVLPLLPFLLIVAGFQGRHDQVPGLFLWTIASFSIGQAAALIGPIGAGLAAYLAGRNASGPTHAVLRSLPDRGASVHLMSLASTLIWIVVAWVLYILYQIILGLIAADWGFLDFMPVVSGLAILLMCVTTGYALGVHFTGRFTPILVGTGLFLISVLLYIVGNDSPQLDWIGIYDSIVGTGTERSIKYLSPMQIFSGAVSTPVATSWGTIGPRFIGWMLGLTTVAAGLLAWWLHSKWMGLGFVAVGGAGAVAAAAALLALPASVAELPKETVAYEVVCDGDLVRVCVHPAYQENLEPTLKIAEAVLGPIQGLRGVPSTIEQFQTGEGGDRVYPIYFENGSVEEIARTYLGVLYDNSHGELSPGQSVIGYWLFSRAVDDPDNYWLGSWLPNARYFSSSTPPPVQLREAVERWEALSDTEQRDWLEIHWTALINGEIGWEELP